MNFLRKTSIKRKQTLIVMLTSGLALLLACIAFAFYEVRTFRTVMVENLSTLAEIIGSNSSAALDFSDPKSAKETLSALQAQPNIVAACIYTAKGEVFAVYVRPGTAGTFVPPPVKRSGGDFGQYELRLFRPIDRGGEFLGTVYVVSDLDALYSRLTRYALIAAGVFLASGLVALAVSSLLQKLISGPILTLVQTARAVTVEKNYSVRAVKQSDDELGVLIDAFNEMLSQIQARDADLQKSHVELENRVRERTGEVVNSLSLVQAALEATTDGILVMSEAGMVTGFNEHFLKMWNISREIMSFEGGRQALEESALQLEEPDKFLSRLKAFETAPAAEGFGRVVFKDGRIFEQYSRPQMVADVCVGRVWSFRDITERRRSEGELEKMHQQLIDTSRQAGMAEVATSVLHNVGNVLNSINTSSTLASDRIRHSKIVSVAKVAALLAEHAGDLGEFLTSDPRGRQIPGYLSQLSEHLLTEQKSVIEELALLHQNVGHVKDIVAMQQSYARISGIIETVKITDLVEDALRLNIGALQRHGVDVIREYEDIPPINVEKHKVLQILVNLVRNAKYACDESLRSDKSMTLRVGRSGDAVHIAVSDNGIGIPAENMTRIFNHGFTTRKEGHGFGLHSAVLAAMEMGGALVAHSDGRDKGASFTLELPYKPQETPQ